jgi:hypothetical protein
MSLTIQTDPVPLRVDEHGVVRVGDSQVLLVIREFHNGADPEAITHGYSTLNLAMFTPLSLATFGIGRMSTTTFTPAARKPRSCARRSRRNSPAWWNCAPNCWPARRSWN